MPWAICLLAFSFSCRKFSSQVSQKEVKSSAEILVLFYMWLAEAVGLIGLKLIEPTEFSEVE